MLVCIVCAAAPVAAMNAHRGTLSNSCLEECNIVGIWVSNAVGAYPFHDLSIVAPVLRPATHVMIARVVNRTCLAFTPRRIVTVDLFATLKLRWSSHQYCPLGLKIRRLSIEVFTRSVRLKSRSTTSSS